MRAVRRDCRHPHAAFTRADRLDRNGALDARHIRLFEPDWWTGYPPRAAAELATALGRLQQNAFEPGADYRTLWELGDSPEAISAFELDQLQRSVDWLRTWSSSDACR
jgi:hypothetical protein